MTDLHQPDITSSAARTQGPLVGTASGGWDNGYLELGGIDFWVQHAWATATYGATSHKFPCFGGPQGAECYPGTSYCANPASLFRLSDLKQAASTAIDIDMVLAILICTRIKTTDPYKWRANYDCTINTGCHPSTEQWVQGDSCGILYGLNGVCHQAANRILAASNGQAPLDLANTVAVEPFPTGILSWLTYGPLGWDIDEFWALVQVLYAGSPAASVQEAEARLIQLHFARSTDVALRRPIIARFILSDPDANAANPAAIEDVVGAYLRDKSSLDADLVTGTAKPEAFAFEVNRRAGDLLKQLGEIAGEAWYRKFAFPGAVLNFVCPAWMSHGDHYRSFARLAPARSSR